MTEKINQNLTEEVISNDFELNHIREYYQTINNLQHEQLIALRKENHQLQLKINYDKERKIIQKNEYEQKLHELQILINDASIQLDEGSELIRKLQQHLKICQEKLSDKTKALLAKDDALHDYQLHIAHLNDRIRQLMDEKTELPFSLNLNDNPKIDVAIQTSPTLSIQRRTVRFNLDMDKENWPIDPKYFRPTTPMKNRSK